MMWSLLLLWFWPVEETAVAGAAPPQTLWREANQAYRDGRFEEALKGYEALLAQGVRNGKLHYNLGNAYYKNGRIGKAVLHYCKARKYLPGDADIAHNLALVSQQRVDPPIDEEFEGFQEKMSLWLRRINYAWIFYGALFCLCLAGLASLVWLVRPHTGKWLGYVMVIGAVLGLLFMGAAFLQYRELTRTDDGVVVAREVAVLSGPSQRESVSFTIHEGIRCRILDQTDGWYRIRLANGYNGWVPRQTVEII